MSSSNFDSFIDYLMNYVNCSDRKKTLFVAFPWVVTSTGPGGFMILCVYFMTGTPKGSTERLVNSVDPDQLTLFDKAALFEYSG